MDNSSWVQTAINAIRVVSFVCDVITFPVYLVVQKPWKRRQLSKRVRVSELMFHRYYFLSLNQHFFSGCNISESRCQSLALTFIDETQLFTIIVKT